MGEALTPEQMGDLLITQRGGQRIYHSDIHLRDVATIEDGLADTRSLARSDGKITLGVGIQKQHGENDVKVGKAVRAFVDAGQQGTRRHRSRPAHGRQLRRHALHLRTRSTKPS